MWENGRKDRGEAREGNGTVDKGRRDKVGDRREKKVGCRGGKREKGSKQKWEEIGVWKRKEDIIEGREGEGNKRSTGSMPITCHL